jgi:hypothetical protein
MAAPYDGRATAKLGDSHRPTGTRQTVSVSVDAAGPMYQVDSASRRRPDDLSTP